jgi:hypothetical protein
MGLQETKEPRPLGEAGEQRPIVARQPALALIMASATLHPFSLAHGSPRRTEGSRGNLD